MASRTFIVPIEGAGVPGLYPYRPKYTEDGGITGFQDSVYNWPEGTVTAMFHGDADVLNAIAAESDVSEVL